MGERGGRACQVRPFLSFCVQHSSSIGGPSDGRGRIFLATVRSTWTLYFDKLGFAKAGGEKYRGFIPYDQSLEVRNRNPNERSLTKDGPGQG